MIEREVQSIAAIRAYLYFRRAAWWLAGWVGLTPPPQELECAPDGSERRKLRDRRSVANGAYAAAFDTRQNKERRKSRKIDRKA